jgi:hypothetical protein
MELEVFVKKIAGLEKHLKKIGPDLLLKHEKEINDLNKKQMLEGKNTEGRIMQRGYSPQYAKKRKKAGLQTGFVDLRFTGKYQDTKKGAKVKEGINLISDVEYEKYLRGNFPDHVGLDKPNAEQVATAISEPLAVVIDKYLS